MSRHQRTRGVGSRTSCQRQQSFPPSPTISTKTKAGGGTYMGPSYRWDGSDRWMEGRELNTRRNGHAINNGGSVLWQRQMRKQRQKWKLAKMVRK